MTLTHVDLFAGIGGFGLALERAGAKTVASVEIDKNCQNILRRHFPGATIFDDITKVGGDELRAAGFIPERGVITGGFPCQDLSIAGRGAGLAGGRSGLFWEIVRLLDDLQPRWFILENVPRLLTINDGRDMGSVAEALVECGYSLAWRVLDAQHFGVPQRRRRIFIVGHLGTPWRAPAEILFEREGGGGDSPACAQAKPETAGGAGFGAGDGGPAGVVDKASTLQGGGQARLSDRRRGRSGRTPDCVAALTACGVGTCGPDDNQAQAGHLIVDIRMPDGTLRQVDE